MIISIFLGTGKRFFSHLLKDDRWQSTRSSVNANRPGILSIKMLWVGNGYLHIGSLQVLERHLLSFPHHTSGPRDCFFQNISKFITLQEI